MVQQGNHAPDGIARIPHVPVSCHNPGYTTHCSILKCQQEKMPECMPGMRAVVATECCQSAIINDNAKTAYA
jgi:hypothetical protein